MSTSPALSLRISPRDRILIDRAAGVMGKTRTEFMLDAARVAATDALLDRRLFLLDDAAFKAMNRTIAKAPKAAAVVAKLQKRASPFGV